MCAGSVIDDEQSSERIYWFESICIIVATNS